MTIYKQFDVVVVPFPFSDKLKNKKRKALVLSSSSFNHEHDVIILGMLTSASHSAWPSDVPIKGLKSAGLKKACVFRHKLFTLDRNIILEKVGRLSKKDREQVRARLRSVI